MSTIPILPVLASETNYAAGTDPWSGTATKIAPSPTWESYGWMPGTPIPAAYENYLKDAIIQAMKDVQSRAVVKSNVGENTVTQGFPFYLPLTKVVSTVNYDSTHYYESARSKDFVLESISANNMLDVMDRSAYGNSSGTAGLIKFAQGTPGGPTTCWLVADTKARTVTAFSPPNANALYTDGCTDVTTSKAVMLSGDNSGTPTYGFASGFPFAGLTFVAAGAGTGWTADANAWCASRAGETRAWGAAAKTFATTDGGVTVGAVADLIWNLFGGLPASSKMIRPTWDVINGQWIVGTVDLTSAVTASSSSYLWTSLDGITWTALGHFSEMVFYSIKYHAGWLWAAARMLQHGVSYAHDCIEVVYSKDGGVTWIRTGIMIGMGTPATLYATSIESCESHLIVSLMTGFPYFVYASIHTGDV